MSVVKSYVKQVLAKLTGDQNQVVAEKNYRKAVAAVKGQIAALEAKIVEDEGNLEDAKEALANAKYPTEEIKGGSSSFISNIVRHQENVNSAQYMLDQTQKSLDFNKALLVEFEAEA